MLNWCIKKVNEVAQDLREPQDGAILSHQADKLDKVRDELQAMLDLLLQDGPSTMVHGGGSGQN